MKSRIPNESLCVDKFTDLKNIASASDIVRFDFKSKNFIYPFLFQKKQNNHLTVVFHGAKDQEKISPPYFERWSWSEVFESSVLNVSDPTLSLSGNLNIGWYLGNDNEYVLLEIIKVVKWLVFYLNIDNKNITFWGSSGGGFAALVAGTLLDNCTSVAFNPQINIDRYYKAHVNRLVKCSFGKSSFNELDDSIRVKSSFIESYKKSENKASSFYVYQNLKDSFHLKNHFKDLENFVLSTSVGNVRLFNYESRRGHSAEDRSLAKAILSTESGVSKPVRLYKSDNYPFTFSVLSELICLSKLNKKFPKQDVKVYLNCFRAFRKIKNPSLAQKEMFYKIASYAIAQYPRGHVIKGMFADFLLEEGEYEKSLKLHRELFMQLGSNLNESRLKQLRALKKASVLIKESHEKLDSLDVLVKDSPSLFRRGFYVSEFESSFLKDQENWLYFTVLNICFYHHYECNKYITKHDDYYFIILGDFFVAHGSDSADDLCYEFSKNNEFQLFDNLSGRFALFIVNSEGCKVLNDAFGSRTIYYSNTDNAVSSHALLLAKCLNAPVSMRNCFYLRNDEYRMRGSYYLPADITLFENLFGLAPNNYYSLCDRLSFRYYPGKAVEFSKGDFYRTIDEYFKNLAAWLIRCDLTAVLGLTSGIDSRAVIAALHYYGVKVKLVTWDRLKDDEMEVVNELRKALNECAHYFVVTKLEKNSDDKLRFLADVSDINSGLWRGKSNLTAKMSEVSEEKEIFIRGLGGEICRGFYNRHGNKKQEINSLILTKMYFGRKIKNPSAFFEASTLSFFEGCVSRCNTMSMAPHGLDNLDFVYWEHRMGMWAANLLNEMDAAIPDFVGINSRKVFAQAFSLPSEERLGKGLMYNVCKLYNSELADITIIS